MLACPASFFTIPSKSEGFPTDPRQGVDKSGNDRNLHTKIGRDITKSINILKKLLGATKSGIQVSIFRMKPVTVGSSYH
jgi:hypothetical protein